MRIINQSNHSQLTKYYEREYARLLYIGNHFCGDREELKDIIQQLFLHFAEIQIDLDSLSNPSSYIITSFKRRLIDYHRICAKREINSAFTYHDFIVASIDKEIEENENSIHMVKKLKSIYEKLPGRCKKVIHLKFYEGLSNDQIIAQTGLSLRSIYNNLSEGIKIMRAGMINLQKPIEKTAS